MSESRRLWIPGPIGRLEATLRVKTNPTAAAVVAHPHPLHGGTQDNAVIFHADRELHRLGLTTLRFNFRGVGKSEGQHDEGQGEVQDVSYALSWIRGLVDQKPLLMVGYSFGSWCGIRAASEISDVVGMIAIGLPVLKYDFSDALKKFSKPLLVIQGSEDEFGTPDQVREVLRNSNQKSSTVTIHDAPHLFPGRAREVGIAVAAGAKQFLD